MHTCNLKLYACPMNIMNKKTNVIKGILLGHLVNNFSTCMEKRRERKITHSPPLRDKQLEIKGRIFY